MERNDRKIALTIRFGEGDEALMKIASEAGFRYVNMGFGDSTFYARDGWEKQIDRIGNALAKNGLTCVMTHSPYYDLRISAEITEPSMALSQKRVVMATGMLGAELCALHPRTYLTGGNDREKSFLCNRDDFLALSELAHENRTMIGIENLPIFPGLDMEFYSCYPEQHVRMLEALSDHAVCAVWDFGHAHLMNYDQAEAIRTVGAALPGGSIRGTHIHNNFKCRDDHLAPSLGTMDWKHVLGALKDTGYKGYLTMEQDTPVIGLESFIKHLYECAVTLDDIFRAL